MSYNTVRRRWRRRLGLRVLGRFNLSAVSVLTLFLLLSVNDFSCERSATPYGWRSLPALAIVVAANSENEKEDRRRTTSTVSKSPDLASKKNLTLNEIFIRAGKRGIGGGVPGFVAGIVQVFSLMWLRTIMNYQCRYGTTFRQALNTLLNEGGIRRLYRGLGFALIQAPIARFVSTAANDGVESFLANLEETASWGPGRTTFVASLVVGLWRMLLMPIDTMKTVLQVDSAEGFRSLMRRVKVGKFGVLYEGAIAYAFSAILGHYPWFFTYNKLSTSDWVKELLPSPLLRNAGIGLVASIVSDTAVNAIRVVKTTKQSMGSKHSMSYSEVIGMVLAADGWRGLFGRGLLTRIFANALQSIVFTILWRSLAERWKQDTVDEPDATD